MEGNPNLNVRLSDLEMKNPTMLAAGILGFSSKILTRVLQAGAGAVATKSISLYSREAYRNPTVVGVDCGYLNAIGLSNPGVSAFKDELTSLKKGNLPIVVSIFGSNADEYAQILSVLEDTPAKAYELNLSCPHVKGVGVEIGSDPQMVFEIVKTAKRNTKKPIFVKLSPNLSSIVSVAQMAEEAGADAITATNTVKAMAIDIETGKPVLTNKVGGLSGPAIKPISLRCVYEISQQLRIPVIGCGGIRQWQDAVEYLLAGASAVQIGTAIAYHGLDIFSGIVNGIKGYLIQKNFGGLADIVGLSHEA